MYLWQHFARVSAGVLYNQPRINKQKLYSYTPQGANMDPNNPAPTNPTNNGFTSYSTPPDNGPGGQKRKLLSKKVLLIGGAILLVIIILIVVLSGGKKSKQQNSTDTQPDASVYIERKGYFNESGGIGDAEALFSEPGSSVVAFKGKNVIQPCALITIKDIRDNGLYIYANQLAGPVSQTAYTGQGSQAGTPSQYTLPIRRNSCTYTLQKDKPGDPAVIDITLYQSFDANSRPLDDEVERRFTPRAGIDGTDFKVYKNIKVNNLSPDESTYFLRNSSVAAELRINLADKSKEEVFLKLLAERLKKAETTPTPLVKYSYKSPVMAKEAYTSCELLSDVNFKQVLGVEASPLTNEKFATAIGITTRIDNQKLVNYTTYDCRREIAKDQGDGAFYIQTETFEDASDAAHMFDFSQKPEALAAGIETVSPTIGDGSFYGSPAAMRNALVVRKGRLIIYVSYQNDRSPNVPAAEKIGKLRPVLESVVKGLRNY